MGRGARFWGLLFSSFCAASGLALCLRLIFSDPEGCGEGCLILARAVGETWTRFALPIAGGVGFVGLLWLASRALVCARPASPLEQAASWVWPLACALASVALFVWMSLLGARCAWCVSVHACSLLASGTLLALGTSRVGVRPAWLAAASLVGLVVGGFARPGATSQPIDMAALASLTSSELLGAPERSFGPEQPSFRALLFVDPECPQCKVGLGWAVRKAASGGRVTVRFAPLDTLSSKKVARALLSDPTSASLAEFARCVAEGQVPAECVPDGNTTPRADERIEQDRNLAKYAGVRYVPVAVVFDSQGRRVVSLRHMRDS